MSHWPINKFMPLRKALSPKTTDRLSIAVHNVISKIIEPYEVNAPYMKTEHPGKTALSLRNTLNDTFAIPNLSDKELINLNNSFGNYFEDVDGNQVLDMFMDNGKNILGYNSRRWIKETKLQKYEKFLIQRPSVGVLPPFEYPGLIRELMIKVAPIGLDEIYLSCGCASSANINALKLTFLKKFFELKGTDKITLEEEQSIMAGKEPGAPKFSVITFEGGNHGKFLELLSPSRINTNNSIAMHNWPVAPFPNIKRPYEDHYAYNRSEETRCVEETEKLIKQNKDKIASLIIEPMQIMGGVRFASSLFYKDLIQLCYDNNVAFICDETNTSGWASGRPFMHLSWNSEKPVHLVTFANRMQISGLFYQKSFRPKYGNMINSTWNGDSVKLIQFMDTYDQITNGDWIDAHTEQFWQSCKAEFLDLQRKSNVPLKNIRGIGKIFAFDVEYESVRNEIIRVSRSNGFKLNPIGKHTIAFTPSLLFTEVHFARFKDFFQTFVSTTLNSVHLTKH